MSKLTYEDKINIYKEWKNVKSVINLAKKYQVYRVKVNYLINLINRHGFDILRTTKNRTYSIIEKERIINRILINNE